MSLRWPLVILAVVVLAAALGFGLSRRKDSELSRRNGTALTALCLQRADLDQQIAVTQTFLSPRTAKERRTARRLFRAIDRDLILTGQLRARKFRQNLSILDCKEQP